MSKAAPLWIFLFFSCNQQIKQADIEISGLKKEYNRNNGVTFSIKSNLKDRVYFHLEGAFFSKDFQWSEFNNNLMSSGYSKTETNYWLEPDSTYIIEIPAERFTRQFKTNQDSFRIQMSYYFEGQTQKNSLISNTFIIK